MKRMLIAIVASAVLTCSCASLENSNRHDVAGGGTAPTLNVASDAQAYDLAIAFTKQRKLDWGQPTGHYRTVSKWYAVQFRGGPRGEPRVVLINPENGQAELPLKKL